MFLMLCSLLGKSLHFFLRTQKNSSSSLSKESKEIYIHKTEKVIPNIILDHEQEKKSLTQIAEKVPELSNLSFSDDLETLKKQVIDSGSYLSLKKRRQDFQNSGFDTDQNAAIAEKIVLAAYPEKLDNESVTKKVVALHLLRYSKHLTYSTCLNMMETLTSQYKNNSEENHKRAIKFDVGAVAYMCLPIGKTRFQEQMEHLTEATLKAQVLNAMTVYKEDEEKG